MTTFGGEKKKIQTGFTDAPRPGRMNTLLGAHVRGMRGLTGCVRRMVRVKGLWKTLTFGDVSLFVYTPSL